MDRYVGTIPPQDARSQPFYNFDYNQRAIQASSGWSLGRLGLETSAKTPINLRGRSKHLGHAGLVVFPPKSSMPPPTVYLRPTTPHPYFIYFWCTDIPDTGSQPTRSLSPNLAQFLREWDRGVYKKRNILGKGAWRRCASFRGVYILVFFQVSWRHLTTTTVCVGRYD